MQKKPFTIFIISVIGFTTFLIYFDDVFLPDEVNTKAEIDFKSEEQNLTLDELESFLQKNPDVLDTTQLNIVTSYLIGDGFGIEYQVETKIAKELIRMVLEHEPQEKLVLDEGMLKLSTQMLLDFVEKNPDVLTDDEVDIVLSYIVGQSFGMDDPEVEAIANPLIDKMMEYQ